MGSGFADIKLIQSQYSCRPGQKTERLTAHQHEFPHTQLFFNVGVEFGQLAFIGAVLSLGWLLRRASVQLPISSPRLAAYVIGSVSAFWVFERTYTAI